jgi:phage-related protein
MDTLTAPWQIASDSQGSSETGRTLHTQFGGDAKNDRPDGINLSPMTYSMNWDLRRADIRAMIDFFDRHAGVVFQWVIPTEGLPRYWLASSWTQTVIDYDHHRLQINLEEQFRP